MAKKGFIEDIATKVAKSGVLGGTTIGKAGVRMGKKTGKAGVKITKRIITKRR